MRTVAQIISWVALVGTLEPSIEYLAGATTIETVKLRMLVFTVVWFVTVPIWMDRAKKT